MAEGKKSFVLYCDLIHTVNQMPDEKAGQLIKHIFRYVNDQDPQTDDLIINIAFEPIKQQLKRDLDKWDKRRDDYSLAGKESAKARSLKAPQIYVLRMYNDTEEFVKVGITDHSVGRRFSSSGENTSKRMPYKYDIMYQRIDAGLLDLLKIESAVRDKFEDDSYATEHHFGGHLECYNINALNKIIEFITSFNIVQHRSTKSTVSVNVNDNVNVIKNNIEDRKLKFASTLKPFAEIYDKTMLNEFYKYWTEPNKSNSKFKQELEKTWDLSRRLETWAKNDKSFGKPEAKPQPHPYSKNLMKP